MEGGVETQVQGSGRGQITQNPERRAAELGCRSKCSKKQEDDEIKAQAGRCRDGVEDQGERRWSKRSDADRHSPKKTFQWPTGT